MGLAAKAAVALTSKTFVDEHVLAGLSSCFSFIGNLIEATDGIPWVRQAVQEGLLHAFVNISPSFHMLEPVVQGILLRLISDVLPRYMVYRSVILAVDTAMTKLECSDTTGKIERSPVKDAWYKMKRLALERLMIKSRSDAIKRQLAYCDNVGLPLFACCIRLQ